MDLEDKKRRLGEKWIIEMVKQFNSHSPRWGFKKRWHLAENEIMKMPFYKEIRDICWEERRKPLTCESCGKHDDHLEMHHPYYPKPSQDNLKRVLYKGQGLFINKCHWREVFQVQFLCSRCHTPGEGWK